MCEETDFEYEINQLVWVKLDRGIWWPARVVNGDENDPNLKAPIATVQFFNEDESMAVSSRDRIYQYNCLRKEEFVRKGLECAGRPGLSASMKKFGADVREAELLTGGNENILNDLRVDTPRLSITQMLFPRERPSPKKMAPKRPTSVDDDSVHSTPGPSKVPSRRRKSSSKKTDSPEKPLHQFQNASTPFINKRKFEKCSRCDFETSFLNTMVWHIRFSCAGFNGNAYVPRSPVSSKQVSRTSSVKSTSGRRGRRPKASKVEPATPTISTQPPNPVSQSPPKTGEIRKQILEDWEEEEEKGEEEEEEVESKENDQLVEEIVQENGLENKKGGEDRNEETSCFDFKDIDESLEIETSLKFGQKLPRVIEKRDHIEKLEEDLRDRTQVNEQQILKLQSQVGALLENTVQGNSGGEPSPSSPKEQQSLLKSLSFQEELGEAVTIVAQTATSSIEPVREAEVNFEINSINDKVIFKNDPSGKEINSMKDNDSSQPLNSTEVDFPSIVTNKKPPEYPSSKDSNLVFTPLLVSSCEDSSKLTSLPTLKGSNVQNSPLFDLPNHEKNLISDDTFTENQEFLARELPSQPEEESASSESIQDRPLNDQLRYSLENSSKVSDCQKVINAKDTSQFIKIENSDLKADHSKAFDVVQAVDSSSGHGDHCENICPLDNSEENLNPDPPDVSAVRSISELKIIENDSLNLFGNDDQPGDSEKKLKSLSLAASDLATAVDSEGETTFEEVPPVCDSNVTPKSEPVVASDAVASNLEDETFFLSSDRLEDICSLDESKEDFSSDPPSAASLKTQSIEVDSSTDNAISAPSLDRFEDGGPVDGSLGELKSELSAREHAVTSNREHKTTCLSVDFFETRHPGDKVKEEVVSELPVASDIKQSVDSISEEEAFPSYSGRLEDIRSLDESKEDFNSDPPSAASLKTQSIEVDSSTDNAISAPSLDRFEDGGPVDGSLGELKSELSAGEHAVTSNREHKTTCLSVDFFETSHPGDKVKEEVVSELPVASDIKQSVDSISEEEAFPSYSGRLEDVRLLHNSEEGPKSEPPPAAYVAMQTMEVNSDSDNAPSSDRIEEIIPDDGSKRELKSELPCASIVAEAADSNLEHKTTCLSVDFFETSHPGDKVKEEVVSELPVASDIKQSVDSISEEEAFPSYSGRLEDVRLLHNSEEGPKSEPPPAAYVAMQTMEVNSDSDNAPSSDRVEEITPDDGSKRELKSELPCASIVAEAADSNLEHKTTALSLDLAENSFTENDSKVTQISEPLIASNVKQATSDSEHATSVLSGDLFEANSADDNFKGDLMSETPVTSDINQDVKSLSVQKTYSLSLDRSEDIGPFNESKSELKSLPPDAVILPTIEVDSDSDNEISAPSLDVSEISAPVDSFVGELKSELSTCDVQQAIVSNSEHKVTVLSVDLSENSRPGVSFKEELNSEPLVACDRVGGTVSEHETSADSAANPRQDDDFKEKDFGHLDRPGEHQDKLTSFSKALLNEAKALDFSDEDEKSISSSKTPVCKLDISNMPFVFSENDVSSTQEGSVKVLKYEVNFFTGKPPPSTPNSWILDTSDATRGRKKVKRLLINGKPFVYPEQERKKLSTQRPLFKKDSLIQLRRQLVPVVGTAKPLSSSAKTPFTFVRSLVPNVGMKIPLGNQACPSSRASTGRGGRGKKLIPVAPRPVASPRLPVANSNLPILSLPTERKLLLTSTDRRTVCLKRPLVNSSVFVVKKPSTGLHRGELVSEQDPGPPNPFHLDFPSTSKKMTTSELNESVSEFLNIRSRSSSKGSPPHKT